jgi:hypothetical protein
VPAIQLSASPQAVVSATNVAGNTAVSWDPAVEVTVSADQAQGLARASRSDTPRIARTGGRSA